MPSRGGRLEHTLDDTRGENTARVFLSLDLRSANGNRIFVRFPPSLPPPMTDRRETRTVVANGDSENRMRLSSRLIRGAVNPRASSTRGIARRRKSHGCEFILHDEYERGRERVEEERRFWLNECFCATQFWRQRRLGRGGPCSFGGRWQANARFGGKRLSCWKRWRRRRRRRVNRGTSVAVVEMPVECRHCRKSQRHTVKAIELGYLFSIARRKLLPLVSLSAPRSPLDVSFVIETKRKNNAAPAIRESRFNAFQFISYNKPALSTCPFCRGIN